MATAPNPITFSGRDYTAETERLRQRAIQILTEWTDHNYSDPGEMIIALQGTTTDLINATVDYYAQENFLDARFRQSLIDQGKKIGYYPKLAAGATTRLRLTRLAGVTGTINIPQWSAFGRSDSLEYLTVSSVQIPDGIDSVLVDTIQGTQITRTLASTDFAINDWTKRPKYNLGANVAAGTVTLTHGSGAFVWREVDTFFEVQPTDLVFLLELNGDDDTVWLTLGNGIRGAGPVTDPMVVTFIRTDAAAGNCGTGVITLVPDALAASISCTNIEMATGGGASPTRESLRESLPDRTSIQRRGVTKGDYQGLVGNLPGVLHVQALDRNNTTYWPHNYKILYVVPNGGDPMSSLLKQQIITECCAKGTEGNWPGRYMLFDVTDTAVDFVMKVGLLQGYDQAAALTAITATLQTFMDPASQKIGGIVSFGTAFNLVMAVPGVSYVEFTTPTSDIVTGDGEFPTLGIISVVFT